VLYEQAGQARAAYGQALLERLAEDLTRQLGRGFSRQNLQMMRQFYLVYPRLGIRQTVSGKSGLFPLSWSHYVLLLGLEDSRARSFYETESVRGGWSVRQLNRQIGSQFYERILLSKNQAGMLSKGAANPRDRVAPEEEIKDPYVLEFLDLKDEYSESDLEEALIRCLEHFLLELGVGFTFVGRQKRLRIGDTWYRVDLVLYHRRLKCLVLIDLKLAEFTHADVGQMHLYLNYAKAHWRLPGENPPVGLILCAKKDKAVAHYALEGLPNKVLASEYKTSLPDKVQLEMELRKTQRALQLYASRRKIK
jgi:predicted nuclease of restriction endonuclease-like (RecB) superfamily